MIRGEHELDTRYQDLAILIHMDGQGTPTVKQQAWQAVTRAAPAGVYEVPRSFRTVHPLGWMSGKVK
jgi:hypothetical protein